MSLQLCSSCRYPFPASGLTKAAFTDKVGKHMETMHSLLSKLSGSAAVMRSAEECGGGDAARENTEHICQQMQVTLQELCASVHEEVAVLRRQAAVAEEQRANRERDLEAANARIADLTTHQDGSNGRSTKFAAPAAGGAVSAATAQRQAALPYFNGGVASYQLRKMTVALDLVSASIYSLLESLAIETRADSALLWIRPRGVVAVELVAPFVVGRDISALRASAPYRVAETSMPAAVSTTGTAVNVKPVVGVRDTRASHDINLNELMESCNVAQLLVPVFNRYVNGATATQPNHNTTAASPNGGAVIGVVHLIGSPRCPFPFNYRNEESATHAAMFLSSIMSTHYAVMAGEWGNHFYQPDILHSTSFFQGRLDLRADEKGIDDFTPTPLLVYRCEKDLNGPTDPRESYFALRTAIARTASPSRPVLTRVRDLHRHATTMESNWTSAVDAATKLEHRMIAMNEESLKEEVQQLRQAREAAAAASGYPNGYGREAGGRPPVPQRSPVEAATAPPTKTPAAATATATPAAVPAAPATGVPTAATATRKPDPRKDSLASVESNIPLTPAIQLTQGDKGGKSEPVLKPEEVNHLESVALRRLENLGVDTTAFHSPPSASM